MTATRHAHLRAMHASASDPRCYELTGTRTVSVRDQMVRAVELVTALAQGADSQIDAGLPLLVIGGGAAGASAALTALALGIDAVVVEREDQLFRRQWGITSRWLDPTEFDWPLAHWHEPRWPPAGSAGWQPMPLPYNRADAANRHARRWFRLVDRLQRAQAAAIAAGNPPATTLQVLPRVHSASLSITFMPTQVTVNCAHPDWVQTRFGAVLSCVSHGEEKVWPHDVSLFRGPPFWSTDRIDDRGLGLGHPAGQPTHALVSGGGDGALQDVQRILCAGFGRRLLERAKLDLRATGVVDTAALTAADTLRNVALESRTGVDAALAVWHDAYVQAADDYWRRLRTAQRDALTRTWLRDEVQRRELHLTWVLTGERPTYCYGLSLFLTTLVLHVYARASGRDPRADAPAAGGPDKQPIVLMRHRLHELPSADLAHRCAGAALLPSPCSEHLHRVQVHNARAAPGAASPVPLGDYHVLVVRHGLEPAPLYGGAAQREQIMPIDWAP